MRLSSSRTWVVDKDLVLMVDSFLRAAEYPDEYLCKAVSDFPSSGFSLRLELLFGPIHLMAPADKAELLLVTRKFMKCLDSIVSLLQSLSPDLTSFCELAASLKDRVLALNACGKTIRNRYIPVV